MSGYTHVLNSYERRRKNMPKPYKTPVHKVRPRYYYNGKRRYYPGRRKKTTD